MAGMIDILPPVLRRENEGWRGGRAQVERVMVWGGKEGDVSFVRFLWSSPQRSFFALDVILSSPIKGMASSESLGSE